MASRLLDLARAYRSALDRQDQQALNRLISAYRLMYSRLEGKVDALLLQIEAEGVTSGRVMRLARYQSLMEQIDAEMGRYSNYLLTELEMSTNDAARLGLAHSRYLALELLREAGISAKFNSLPNNAIKQMLGFLQEGSPLYDRIDALAGVQAQRVRDALMEGIGLGLGPRETARMIQDAFGMGLTDALRMTRTADLWSYREAARANYQNNSDIVSGWIWTAEKDGDTCGACLAEDGSIHGLDEPLDGHWNCRCAPVPYVEGLSEQPQTGEAWFNEQDEATQKAILGPGKWEALQAGKFQFSQLATQTADETYGTMRIEATLKALISAESE